MFQRFLKLHSRVENPYDSLKTKKNYTTLAVFSPNDPTTQHHENRKPHLGVGSKKKVFILFFLF